MMITDMKEMLITMTNNVECIAAFDRRYLEGSENEKTKVLKMIAHGMQVVSQCFSEDFFHGIGRVDVTIELHSKLKNNLGKLDKFYERVIEEHLIDPMRPPKQGYEDCVDILLRAEKESHLNVDHTKGMMMASYIPLSNNLNLKSRLTL
ncbi:hypothetical protein ACLOJK_009248 [Asimina triloba]